jgi:hypothetical protein
MNDLIDIKLKMKIKNKIKKNKKKKINNENYFDNEIMPLIITNITITK